MAFIKWDNKYSVNIKAIDEQHKKLVDLLNQLFEAMKMGKGNDVIGEVLKGVVDYTKFHFKAEEELLVKNNYPLIIGHQQQHKEFVAKLVEFVQQYNTGTVALSMKVSSFLKDWLINHINGTDKKYSAFLNENGVY